MRILQDIIDSETKYLKEMNQMKKVNSFASCSKSNFHFVFHFQVFYNPLKELSETNKAILKQNELIELFTDSIEVIIQFSDKMLHELQTISENLSSLKDWLNEVVRTTRFNSILSWFLILAFFNCLT